MTGLELEQFSATSTAQLRASFELTRAGWAVDHPDEPMWAHDSFVSKWGPGFDDAPRERWLATDGDGGPAGAYLLRLPDQENTSRADVTMIVAPDRRRSGVGRFLLAHAIEQARAAGRSWLTAAARDDTPGAAFAAAAGAVPGIAELIRMLDVTAAQRSRWASLRAEALPRAAGYSLISWVGPTSEELLPAVAAVHSAMADAPRDAGVEATAWTADRVRRMERVMVENGLTEYSVAARHNDSGEVAAITQLCTEYDTPDWAFQQITAVLPSHRGRRLGLLVKIANLELLAERAPAVRRVQTFNAGANEHMIAINAQLGCRVAGASRNWELSLAGREGCAPTAARPGSPAQS